MLFGEVMEEKQQSMRGEVWRVQGVKRYTKEREVKVLMQLQQAMMEEMEQLKKEKK